VPQSVDANDEGCARAGGLTLWRAHSRGGGAAAAVRSAEGSASSDDAHNFTEAELRYGGIESSERARTRTHAHTRTHTHYQVPIRVPFGAQLDRYSSPVSARAHAHTHNSFIEEPNLSSLCARERTYTNKHTTTRTTSPTQTQARTRTHARAHTRAKTSTGYSRTRARGHRSPLRFTEAELRPAS
jgi:hypothetical protein